MNLHFAKVQFLSQVIHANPTLAVTVESFLAWRLARGLSPCSTDTGGYARARQRLPEALLAKLTRHTGREAERAALGQWRWLGHVVKLFDGSTVSMSEDRFSAWPAAGLAGSCGPVAQAQAARMDDPRRLRCDSRDPLDPRFNPEP